MSDDVRRLERLAAEAPDDAVLKERLATARARRPEVSCAPCQDSGEIRRRLGTEDQAFPCPRCRPLDYYRVGMERFMEWREAERERIYRDLGMPTPPGRQWLTAHVGEDEAEV